MIIKTVADDEVTNKFNLDNEEEGEVETELNEEIEIDVEEVEEGNTTEKEEVEEKKD
jgi:hypothetical protein